MSSPTPALQSPVEERHIDYILEEEFCTDPGFLEFFLQTARQSVSDASRIPVIVGAHNCAAVRSVTTANGESDVLVTYGSKEQLPVAILIEDKIRANFQPDQPGRYRGRGEAGKGTAWSEYWTCLVAHQKYAATPGDFDAIVTLQELHSYFETRPDRRSQFRARILTQAIRKYETSGLQHEDDTMTRFRHYYAASFEAAFPPDRWWHQSARAAWWGDTWFECHGTHWPKGVFIRHQGEPGRIQLIFPLVDLDLLHSLVRKHAAWNDIGPAPAIDVVFVGKDKSAFQLRVPPIKNFSEPAPLEEHFAAIEYLGLFYERCSDMLPPNLRVGPHQPNADADTPEMRALYAMLLGFLRSAVTLHGTAMPFPLPELRKLAAGVQDEELHFPSIGLMGGFDLALRHEQDGEPYVLATQSSRQWGTYEIQHRITRDEVRKLASGEID